MKASPALIISAVSLAALAWAGWEIHLLRRANAELAAAAENVASRRPTRSAAATPAPAVRGPAGSSAPSAPQTQVASRPGKPGDPKPNSIDSLIALMPEVRPDGSVVIGKGTSREITVSAEEAAQLSANLARATADAKNRGPNGASYSAGKATGAPDGANHGGDSSSAWCPAPANGANEWLQLKYAKNVEIAEVNIHETYATGALSKVTAVMPDGKERIIWEGTEPVEAPPVERVLKVPAGIRADQLRITMDGTRIGNWQEIDAVEIVGKDGSRQWASEATASSYYGSGNGWGANFGRRGLGEFDNTRWHSQSPLSREQLTQQVR